jgi:hypothetical protein
MPLFYALNPHFYALNPVQVLYWIYGIKVRKSLLAYTVQYIACPVLISYVALQLATYSNTVILMLSVISSYYLAGPLLRSVRHLLLLIGQVQVHVRTS